ncbi:MAG TPA: hypothetical protein VND87_05820 [Stellaceae bacterium]|nr:hypothetical protein [Stellaceae bacterium]
MDAVVSLVLVMLMLALTGGGAYRCARAYGRVFWATMGMTALAVAAIVPLTLVIGINGWGPAHPGLATAAIMAAIGAMVVAIAIVGNRMARRLAAPPSRRPGRS